jgi:hypothetical protein
MARAGLLLLVLLLVLPSANYQVFDGLPLSRAPEFLALVLLIPLLASRALRRLYARWVGRWPRVVQVALVTAAVAAVGIKTVLLASGTYQGFLTCYRSPLQAPPAGPCERSFESPFARFSVTRIDPRISFGEYDWTLGFLNTVRLERHSDGLQGRLRQRLPIEAWWRGEVERLDPWVARITYVGEASLLLDPEGPATSRTSTVLPPHYGALAVAFVPVPAGRHTIRVEYRFDDASTWSGPPPVGPWATIRIERGRGPSGREPGAVIAPVRPARPWRAAGVAGDVAIATLAVSLLLFYVRLLGRDAWLLALVGGATTLVDRFGSAWLGASSSLGLCLLLALVAGPLLGQRWRRRLVGAFFAVLYVAWFVTLRTYPRLDVVTLRERAGDPLVYESHARAILETWSLEGGESIFRYQPLFRYVRFVERLVLGDGDGLVSIVALAALYWALCWAIARLWPRPRASAARVTLLGGVAILLFALASTPPVVFFVQVSLSEYPTWIFLGLAFPLLFASRSPRHWGTGTVLVGLTLLTRPNQALAVLGLLVVFAWRTWPVRPRATMVALALTATVLALPAAHNFYYGGQVVLLSRGASRLPPKDWQESLLANAGARRPTILKVPPQDWLRVHDLPVRREMLNQIDHLFYVNPVDDPPPRGDPLSRHATRGLQILWLTAGVLAFRRRGFARGTKILLVALPLLYLGVHFVYVVDDYYPRHIIAGHLAMALVTLNAVGRGWPRREP